MFLTKHFEETNSFLRYDLTGWDIIHLRNCMTDPNFHLIRNVDESGFKETFNFLGLSTEILDRKWHMLSGGQKIRVRLASVLLVPKAVIIADELTSGLDSVTAHDVMCLLKRVHTNNLVHLKIDNFSFEMTAKYSLNVFVAVHQPSGEVLALGTQRNIRISYL